jgi:GTP cyclohydrolase I
MNSGITMLSDLLEAAFPNQQWDDGVAETARRVWTFWAEFGPPYDMGFNLTTFPATQQQMVAVANIEFSSICAHHLLPFYGVAHVAYIPHDLMIGVSKIPRIVQFYARRPQVQEQLTGQIARCIQDALSPKGSGVVLKATHTCMSCRGITSRNAEMITSELKGILLTSGGPRDEFYALIGMKR